MSVNAVSGAGVVPQTGLQSTVQTLKCLLKLIIIKTILRHRSFSENNPICSSK